MLKTVFRASAITMALLIASCSGSKPEPVSSGKIAEARQYLQRTVTSPVSFRVFGVGDSYIKTLAITPRKINIVTENRIGSAGRSFTFPLKNLSPGSGCDDVSCITDIYKQGDMDLEDNFVAYEFYIPRNDAKNTSQIVYNLAYALETLKEAARQEQSANPEFKAIADNYRDQSSKPALPENVEHLKAQAETAVRDKKFDDAADDYAQALEMAAWWPEGHRSLALALAELEDYPSAIDEMKCYLMLVPDASDAKASKKKIKEWKRTLSKKS